MMFLETSAKTAANVAAVFDAIAKMVAGAGAPPSGPTIPALQNAPPPIVTRVAPKPQARTPPPKQPSKTGASPSSAATSSASPQKPGGDQASQKAQSSASSLPSNQSAASTTSDGASEPLPPSSDAAVLDAPTPSHDAPARNSDAPSQEAPSPGQAQDRRAAMPEAAGPEHNPSTTQSFPGRHAATFEDTPDQASAEEGPPEEMPAAPQKAESSSEASAEAAHAAEKTDARPAVSSKQTVEHADTPSVTQDSTAGDLESGKPGETKGAASNVSTARPTKGPAAVKGKQEHPDQKAAADKDRDSQSKSG